MHEGQQVAGTYTYNPQAGVGLDPGIGQEPGVAFSPSDTWNYTAATGSVEINVLYTFGGFQQPFGASRQTFRLGSTIPVKIQIFGTNGSVPDAVVRLDVYKLNDEGSYDPATDLDLVPDGADDLFRYDATAQQYVYNFSTKGLASSGPGQYALVAQLDDGTSQTVQVYLK